MKTISIALSAALLGCTTIHFAVAADAAGSKEKILYSFCSQQNCADGRWAYSSLLDENGTLYGTTANGGSGADGTCGGNGCGTVFSLDPGTRTEKVLYSFCSQTACADGASPNALLAVNGILYGTTAIGGGTGCNGRGCGTVFSLDPTTGTETVLYSFAGGSDGVEPAAGLIAANGIFYGTTSAGGGTGCGGSGCGTVFSLDPGTSAEKVLYSFAGGTDGQEPLAALLNVKGTLYGTTAYGGANSQGTVFAVNRKTGSEKVLYSFCSQNSCADGETPVAPLIDVKGVLYGTTQGGGTERRDGHEPGIVTYGTVFALDPNTGAETVLHSFGNTGDGQYPDAGVIAVKDTLYGTTLDGGAVSCGGGGCGTVYAVDRGTGAETVIHSFAGDTDGEAPNAELIAVKGRLYSTTIQGGAADAGTVFVIRPKR